jgi:hypothetical protein
VSLALQKWLVVGALFLGMGAHWAILQSVAWTGMVITYSQHSSSFKEALQKTFDGKHPCGICKVVKAGRCSEQNQDRQKLLLKLDVFIYGIPTETLYPPSLETMTTSAVDLYRLDGETPPTPPPISA